MKRNLWLIALLLVASNGYGQVLIHCGRPLNWQYEYELYTKTDFATARGQWSLRKYGKTVNTDENWTARTLKAADKDGKDLGFVGGYVVSGQSAGVKSDLAFVNFTACYDDSSNEAVRLQITRDTGDGNGKQLVKTLSCDCQLFD